MNTTAPRVKAGGPPPLQLHRGVVTPIPSAYKPRGTKLQIDFVLPDDEVIRRSFDAAMKMPISKPIVPQPLRDSEREATKDMKASDFAFWFWSRAMWTGCFFGLGVLYARHFS